MDHLNNFSRVRIMHKAVLKKFNIKSFDELSTFEKQRDALDYMEVIARKLLNKKNQKIYNL